MATPPTLDGDFATPFDTTLPNTVAATVGSGRTLITACANSEYGTGANLVSTPTGGPTWNINAQVNSPGSICHLKAFDSTYSANYTHSQTSTGSGIMAGGIVWVYSGSDGFDSSNSGHTTVEPPQISLSPGTANCAIVYFGADYLAADDPARDWLTINGGAATEDVYFRDASYFTVYAAHWADAGAVGTKTAGLNTSAAAMEVSQVIIAIKGSAAAPAFVRPTILAPTVAVHRASRW